MRPIIVEKRKWSGTVTARWTAQLVDDRDGRAVWLTPAGTARERPGRAASRPTSHPELSAASGEWWVATLVGEGRERRWKIDAATPVSRQGDRMSFVDLDLDVLIGPGRRLVVRDIGQLAARAPREGYPPTVVLRAIIGIASALLQRALGRWPFDGSVEGIADGLSGRLSTTTKGREGASG